VIVAAVQVAAGVEKLAILGRFGGSSESPVASPSRHL
jgi:hypothetical protein